MNKNLQNKISASVVSGNLESFENELAKINIVLRDGCGIERNFSEVLADVSSEWSKNSRAIKIGNWKILFNNGKFSGFFKCQGIACGDMTQVDEAAWKSMPLKQKLSYILN